MSNELKPENRYHRPFGEIADNELLRAIRKQQQDAEQAREELHRRGWTDENIAHWVAYYVKRGIL